MRYKLLLLFLCCGLMLNALPVRDSLFRVWNNKQLPDTVRLAGMEELIWSHYLFNKPDSAYLLSQQMEAFARAARQDSYTGRALNMQGVYFKNKGDYAKAMSSYKASRELYESCGNKKGAAGARSNAGQVLVLLGNRPLAVEEYFAALKTFEEIGDKPGQMATLINIGSAYLQMDRQEEAMTYYTRAKALGEALKNKRAIAICLNNISSIHSENGNFTEALKLGEEAVTLRESMGDRIGLADALHNMGETYVALGDYPKARVEMEKAMALYRELNDSSGLARCYQTVGVIDFRDGKYPGAIRSGKLALQLSQEHHLAEVTRKAAELLVEAYSKTGNYRAALEMYEIAVTVRDSLANSETRETLNREQLKYDYEKKVLADKAAADQRFLLLKTSAEIEKSKRNTWLIVLSVLLVLVAVSGVFIFRVSRQRSIIAEQKSNLLRQKLLISQLNPHFIFNSLNAVQNFIFSQDRLQAGTYLARFAGLIRMILDFSREDFISVASETRFLSEYLELQQLRFPERFRYRIDVDESIDPESTFIPPMLAQPFVENAIEHGIAAKTGEGLICVRIFRRNEHIVYEIDDNGIGLAASALRTEKAGSTHRSLATVITRERLEVLNAQQHGEIRITDKQQLTPGVTGVNVHFTLPFYEQATTA